MSKSASEQQRINDQIRFKLQEKERYEQDCKRAQEKLSRNSADSNAAHEVEQATEQIKRIDWDIENLHRQLI